MTVGDLGQDGMDTDTPSELRHHWPVIAACFFVAVYAWGFGFYGQAVYLAELQATRGWPAALISAATTCMYLGGALLMPFVHGWMQRHGPRRVLMAGVLLLGLGACGMAAAYQPWQVFPAALVMSAGWATTTGTAIATTMSFCFDRRRGLALSLALNGASAGGFTVAPLLVTQAHTFGLTSAVLGGVVAGWVVLVPLVAIAVPRGVAVPRNTAATPGHPLDPRPAYDTKPAALRDRRFWSVALPFALAIAAQVGFIVHMVSFLLPSLGPDGTSAAVSLASLAAMLGRIGLGFVIDRLPQRPISAISFASQAAGLGLMLVAPHNVTALFAGSLLFGASVGNVITLPAILVQREFAARSFGLLIGLSGAVGQFTLAFGPALFGVLRDLTGSYAAVLAVCIGLQLTASALVLKRPRPLPAGG